MSNGNNLGNWSDWSNLDDLDDVMETSLTIDYDKQWLNCVSTIGPSCLYFYHQASLWHKISLASKQGLLVKSGNTLTIGGGGGVAASMVLKL